MSRKVKGIVKMHGQTINVSKIIDADGTEHSFYAVWDDMEICLVDDEETMLSEIESFLVCGNMLADAIFG